MNKYRINTYAIENRWAAEVAKDLSDSTNPFDALIRQGVWTLDHDDKHYVAEGKSWRVIGLFTSRSFRKAQKQAKKYVAGLEREERAHQEMLENRNKARKGSNG